MENRQIAQILFETADLLEVSAADSFRIRSYRRAAEAVESSTVAVGSLAGEPKKLLEIPGIGKGMAANILQLEQTGKLALREELLARYKPSMLELLRLPGMGPKTVALFWDALQIASIDELEAAAREGRLEGLPRCGPKQVAKILQGILDYRQHAGRFHLDVAETAAEKLAEYIRAFPGVARVTPTGSLRRGRETVGDLDLLVTGPACASDQVSAVVDHVATYPSMVDLIAKGQNKVSFHLRHGLQVDVRMLPEESFGAALQYFTGSKMHNVAIRQRALKRGYTLNEYALARLEDGVVLPSGTEEEIYAALGIAWIPPELREGLGEIEAAEQSRLPRLIEQSDIRGDLHMHSDATDGRNTVREMAEAALERGYSYIAITDHSKNLAMTNGLDDQRALDHVKRICAIDHEMEGRIRIFSGIEVDILADGALDLCDSVLAQMDVVVASVHSYFNQPSEQMTERILRAVENPFVRVLGHPTGRLLLRREPYAFDLDAVLRRCGELGVAVEHNSYPDRLDLNDRNLRRAHELGCKIVVNTDAHHTSHLDKMRFGIRQLRRAWLQAQDVLNTMDVGELMRQLRARPA
ncbi:MAG TPA: DNA polymerase/3'-5' exonuclease PolX [Acidobacteriaceae bacterium]|nr:DNA polymerase/3'-5' exonuclease PolX [Acidobacteriaceae bacterium]